MFTEGPLIRELIYLKPNLKYALARQRQQPAMSIIADNVTHRRDPMKIRETKNVLVTTDVLCDVCGTSTTKPGTPAQYGVLSAHWGYGSQHDGERYEVHLCEGCFFSTLTGLRRQRMVEHLFDEVSDQAIKPDAPFGLVERDNYFKD